MPTNINYKFLNVSELEVVSSSFIDQVTENAKELKLIISDEKLVIDGTTLKFHSIVESKRIEGAIDLANVWLPGAPGWEHPVPLLLYPNLSKAIIEVVDKYACKASHTPTFAKTGVTSQFNVATQFVEWACLNGHFQLQEISKKQFIEFNNKISEGGINTILELPTRIEQFIDNLIVSDELDPFLIKDGDTENSAVTSLRISLIAKSIGSVSLENQVSSDIYKKVYEYLKSKNIKVGNKFPDKGGVFPSQPSAKSLNNWFGTWNRFANIDNSDHLPFVPFPKPSNLAKQLGKAASRTNNIEIEHVIALLGISHDWIYEYSPKIISVVKDIKAEKDKLLEDGVNARYITETMLPQFIEQSAKVKKLEKQLSINIHKTSLTSSKNTDEDLSITEIITLLMSACYLILQTYNAKRQAEIQDPHIGVQEEYFRCKSKKYNWYQACFYNEKHGERRWYTLNNGSAKALKCLIDLKNAWEGQNAEGLFNVPTFRLTEKGNFKHYKYHFNKGKGSKITGNAFLKMALGDASNDIGSHMFRRIYAIIYHYQYKNADLLALCFQMGHVDPTQTLIYVTDPDSRQLHEQLHHKVKLTKNESAESTIAITEENKVLEKIIDEVGIETTSKDILSLMMGTEEMAGKYTSYLKKVYRVLQRSVKFGSYIDKKYGHNFSELSQKEQSNEIANVMHKKGHKHNPKPHATCHKKPGDIKKNEAPCEPLKCKGCAFQEVRNVQLKIMKEDLIDLQKQQSDFSALPIEKLRAKEQVTKLTSLIENYQRSMAKSQTIFTNEI